MKLIYSWCELTIPNTYCDMIKRNESDIGDVGLEISAKTVLKFLLFYIVFSIVKSFITL